MYAEVDKANAALDAANKTLEEAEEVVAKRRRLQAQILISDEKMRAHNAKLAAIKKAKRADEQPIRLVPNGSGAWSSSSNSGVCDGAKQATRAGLHAPGPAGDRGGE